MPRFAAIALPNLRVEIAEAKRAAEVAVGAEAAVGTDGAFADVTGAPLAVVIARPGSVVQEETALLGNTKIDEVSRAAWELGVRPGMTIAAARAKTADLLVRVVPLAAVEERLAMLAEMALSFGATTTFEAKPRGDVVWIDVTGCGHLHVTERDRDRDPSGERALAAKIAARVQKLGFVCRVAIADGPNVAAMVAWHLPTPARTGPSRGAKPRFVVVPEGANGRALARLPLSALPVEEGTHELLRTLGLRTIGDVQALPPASLGVRLGERARAVTKLLEGDDRAPLRPHVPKERPEERVELEYGVESSEAILFVAKGLCERLAARLDGRGLAVATIVFDVKLDRALLPEEERSHPHATMRLALPSPLSDAKGLFAVIRARIESFVLPAPALAVSLRADELVPKTSRARDLFVPEAKAEEALPKIVAELSAELGDSAVGMLGLADRWACDERSVLVPFATARRMRGSNGQGAASGSSAVSAKTPALEARLEGFASLLSRTSEPTRWVNVPFSPPEGTRVLGHRTRLEAVEWWRRGVTSFDYVAAWLPDRRVAWVEIDRASGDARVRGFLD
jgi:protein ImuB